MRNVFKCFSVNFGIMKLSKTIKRFCPFCNSHKEHKVSQSKKKGAGTLTYGSKSRVKRRGLGRGFGSLGRYSKKALSAWKRTGKKSSKKTDLRFECSSCNKSHAGKNTVRTKKVEFV